MVLGAPFFPIGPRLCSESTHNQNTPHEEKTHPIWSNWILVIVAGGGIFVAWKTLKTLIVQADAAKLSAQAVINSERAWVEVGLGPPEVEPFDDENTDTFLRYSVQVSNHGRTVARIESFQLAFGCFAPGSLRFEDLIYKIYYFPILLGNQEKYNLTNVDLGREFSGAWEGIQQGTTQGYAHMIVRYRDVVGGTEVRQTSVVYNYDNLNEEPFRLAKYNKYT